VGFCFWRPTIARKAASTVVTQAGIGKGEVLGQFERVH
jgi:hypothetical protein